jgi:hypothetical protein
MHGSHWFHRIAALALVPAATACTFEDDALNATTTTADPVGLQVASATFVTNNNVPEEHCRVHQDRITNVADATRWRRGTQLLIFRGTTLRGMCTVNATAHSGGVDEIQVSALALTRRVALASEGSATTITGVTVRDHHSAASAPPVVVSRTTVLGDLELDDDLAREYVQLPASAPWTVYTAPHPWENFGPPPERMGKPWTQFRAVEAAANALRDGYWAVGFQGNDGDLVNDISNFRRFHITSSEISELSFPGLAEAIGSGARYAVAFHGTGPSTSPNHCNQGIKVGGSLGIESADRYAFRRGIAENIRALVDPSDPDTGNGSSHLGLDPAQVRYVDGSCANSHNGTENANFVNRIATYNNGGTTIRRGVQIENGGHLDPAIYERSGLAVREVFDCLDATPDQSVAAASAISVASNGTGYAAGRCRGFVVDANLTSATPRTWTAGLTTCTPGAKAHVDIYRWNQTALSWDRVGGGEVTYASVGGSCQPTATAYDDDTDLVVPAFAPGAAGNQAALYRVVAYGYTGTHFTAATALPVSVVTQ